ncbi:hypothetical protein [Cellulosilyticum lentocellum]|uniref:Uncharacterized protein n=1 Tax=Cellulosilyticum lentocellum (strain ATCC 49066 / DSM 5427 / NCIMB 11756 / RHM5) TaxID=642492 RepID=F2JPE6_CELLD|nr:hypothetical protein [Cellulosilyticum lentocellum]ADZ82494.1 hypothetical protein Clole_0761 [Cellulosilyticum lentocellum DSM 5427]
MGKLFIKPVSAVIIAILLLVVTGKTLLPGVFHLINRTDVAIYNIYATDGRFGEDIFFSKAIIEKSNLFEEISSNLDEDISIINSKQELTKVLYNNKDIIAKIINNNKVYSEYLKGNEVTVDDFFNWCKKISEIDEVIVEAVLFITCLIYAFIFVGCYKYRKRFYLFAGIIYVIFSLSVFSKGMSDYLLVHAFNYISLMENITYNEMEVLRTTFMSAFKESMVTFIIFDTLIQLIESKRIERKKQNLKDLIYSLDHIFNVINNCREIDTIYRLKFRFSIDELLILCKKNKGSYYRRLGKQIKDDFFWDSGHTSEEYMHKLKLIREYIWKCDIIAFMK